MLMITAGPVLTASASRPADSSSLPANAVYVSATTGNDANPGTVGKPLRTAAAAVRRASSGTMTTIVLRGGEYRESLGSVHKPISLQPYPGEEAWFKGSTPLPGTRFVRDGSAWRLDGWNPDICRPGPGGKACVHPPDIIQGNLLGGDPEMAFADGRPLRQVSSRDQVKAGSFHWDSANGTLLVGTDPRAHTIEVSHLRYAMHFLKGSENSVIRGLGFAHYATSQDYRKPHAAIVIQASGVTIEDSTVAHNAAAGVAAHATGLRLNRNYVTANGSNGILSHKAGNLIMSGNRIIGNNQERTGLESSASLAGAGMKATYLRNAVIRDNIFEDNLGTGFWCDLSCENVTVVRNLARANTKHGLYYEVSGRGLIASNMLVGNGQNGIKISGSNHVRVYNNTLADNAQPLLVAEDPRPHLDRCSADNCPSQDALSRGITWDTADVTIVNNIFMARSGTAPLVDTVDANNRTSGRRVGADRMIPAGQMDNNGYRPSAPDGRTVLVKWVRADGGDVSYTSLADFRRTGREANGRYLEAGDTAFSAEKRDLEVVPDSPAETAGRPLPADVAAAVGVPAGVPVALGALRWPGEDGGLPSPPVPSPSSIPSVTHPTASPSPSPSQSRVSASPRPIETVPPSPSASPSPPSSPVLGERVHYMIHARTGHVLMTLNGAEAGRAVQYGYEPQDTGFLAAGRSSSGVVPIYRLRHPSTGDRLFIRSAVERENAISRLGYAPEIVAFYAAPSAGPGTVAVYRLLKGAYHHYAVGPAARDEAVANGWRYEHVAFHVRPATERTGS
ncbi:hypothetical protein GCM10010156_46900 [Planobispora rosea]|uniref:DUF1565 domain-containing protein n=2 Tax=Planobispora rosea TaxID=35762 RepID=A0A8J3RZL4_PLARO|nr:right-handed parallel beta-helix repeat-containing protein [Planobispora rosea]GGS82847.1 hypothetical protein GCM10010156_46900 [Planobispora rosea]GIH84195.1 hypothetical protein Pro02_26030 [Planobispora rosea]